MAYSDLDPKVLAILLGPPKPPKQTKGPLDRMMVTLPYCTCKHPGTGFTRRADGVWVKPCCGRRQKAMWLTHGDHPIESDLTVRQLRRLVRELEASDARYPLMWNRVRIDQLKAEIASRPKRRRSSDSERSDHHDDLSA